MGGLEPVTRYTYRIPQAGPNARANQLRHPEPRIHPLGRGLVKLKCALEPNGTLKAMRTPRNSMLWRWENCGYGCAGEMPQMYRPQQLVPRHIPLPITVITPLADVTGCQAAAVHISASGTAELTRLHHLSCQTFG